MHFDNLISFEFIHCVRIVIVVIFVTTCNIVSAII